MTADRVTLSITWRMATQDELERCEVTDRANLIDGASALLKDGELIGICDEYGTCVWYAALARQAQTSGAEAMGQKDAIERLNKAAGELAV